MSSWEMGGYLPLEIRQKDSYFSMVDHRFVLELNTGRTAIWCALKSWKATKVCVPYFYCPDIIEMLNNEGFTIRYYHVGKDLLPLDVTLDPDEVMVLVNYFGLLDRSMLSEYKKYSKVILDQAHSFFATPVIEDGVMNVYSCRKFFGVCDGAYLVGKEVKEQDLPEDSSWKRAGHLFRCIEEGTNAAYADSKRAEQSLSGFRKMSPLTRYIMSGIDYEYVWQKRNQNYQYLQEQVHDLQMLKSFDPKAVPYAYPLLLDQDIHAQLVAHRVYVPYLWTPLLEEKWEGTTENRYTRNIVPLPLDQRYDRQSLDKMIQIIRECLKK